MFAAVWLGTKNDMVPEAGDAREVSDRLFEAGDVALDLPCEPPSYRRTMVAAFDDGATLADHSSWVH